MSTDATSRLAALDDDDFANGRHRDNFIPALHDVATAANETANNADAAALSAAAASASLGTAQAIIGGAQGVGADPLDVTRVAELGSAAFAGINQIRGVSTETHDATFQILPQDFGKLLLCTSGTRTWTAPLGADLPDEWWVLIKNRSGNNLTLNLSGSDTINAAASSLTIATGTALRLVKSAAATFESV